MLWSGAPQMVAMLYRDSLLRLGGVAPAFLAALSSRQRDHLPEELRAVYALGQTYGTADLLAAMALADEAGTYQADALAVLLHHPRLSQPPLRLVLPGQPSQTAVDRSLQIYEAWVHQDRTQAAR